MSQNRTEQIEDFLLGRLNQKEHEAFEKALIEDKALQEEVSFKKLAIKGTKQSVRSDLKERLKRIHKENESIIHLKKETKTVQIWPKWLGVAASVLLLITAGFFFLDKGEFNMQVAFKEYYQAPPLRLASRDINADNTILQLNEFYNNKDYDKALPIFQKLLAIDAANTRMLLGAGICHLELNQLKPARSQFLPIIEAQDFRLQHQANWYIALTYLKEENLEDVQKYLAPIITDSKADHHEHAIEIMERLSNS